MQPFDKFIFSIKFCEIFQGFIKKIPGFFQGFQGFPGPQIFQGFPVFPGPVRTLNTFALFLTQLSTSLNFMLSFVGLKVVYLIVVVLAMAL